MQGIATDVANIKKERDSLEVAHQELRKELDEFERGANDGGTNRANTSASERARSDRGGAPWHSFTSRAQEEPTDELILWSQQYGADRNTGLAFKDTKKLRDAANDGGAAGGSSTSGVKTQRGMATPDAPIDFEYIETPFDDNGVVYFLSTLGKTALWQNAANRGQLDVIKSDIGFGDPKDLVGKKSVNLRTYILVF